MKKSILQIVFSMFVATNIMGCAPTAGGFFTKIPVAPYGDSWVLEIKDLTGKVTLANKYERGTQNLRTELAQGTPAGNSGGVTVTTFSPNSIRSFTSGKILLPNINLFYAAEVTELKSNDLIGVAVYIFDESNRSGNKNTLVIYPDNTKTTSDQIGCKFLITNFEPTESSGDAVVAQSDPNQQPASSFMPTIFSKKGTCSLKKSLIAN